MKNTQKKIGFVSLGCDKNRCDLEYIINDFVKNGFKFTEEENAEIIVVNTCGFIEEARQEAVDVICDVAQRKKDGSLKLLVVTGCLPNCEDFDTIKENLPFVDRFVKIEEQKDIVPIVHGLLKTKHIGTCSAVRERTLTTVGSMAYLKICDGCNNFCSYCRIPLIRGRFVSRERAEIVEEAEKLASGGVKEIVLVGQDITEYGKDLKRKTNLVSLLKDLIKIKDLEWIRLLYCYPESITDELIDLIKNNKKICKYIDVPLQHIDNTILKAMNRRVSEEKIKLLINKLQTNVPDIAIRTTFIVGFPGEKKAQFNKLLNFVKQFNLAYMGVFAYSKEEGTIAARLPKQLSARVKNKRKRILEKETKKANNRFIKTLLGKTLNAVCSDKLSEQLYEFRTEYNAPEIDTAVYVEEKEDLIVGEFYNIEIIETNNNLIKGRLIK